MICLIKFIIISVSIAPDSKKKKLMKYHNNFTKKDVLNNIFHKKILYFIFTLSGEQLLLEEQDHTRTMLRNIQSLAEDLYRNEITNLKNEKIPQPPEGAMSRIHQPIFPHLESAVVQDIIDEGLAIQMKEKSAFANIKPSNRLVPMEQRILHQNQTKLPNSARRLEVLRQCIGSIFENRLADAKKTFPAVLSALKSRQARVALCDELALYKSGNQVILEHQQFDMVCCDFTKFLFCEK